MAKCLKIPLAPGEHTCFAKDMGRNRKLVRQEATRARMRKQREEEAKQRGGQRTGGLPPGVLRVPHHVAAQTQNDAAQDESSDDDDDEEPDGSVFKEVFFSRAREKAAAAAAARGGGGRDGRKEKRPPLVNEGPRSRQPPHEKRRVKWADGGDDMCRVCGNSSATHAEKDCFMRTKQCFSCDEVGHLARVCPVKASRRP